MKQSLFLIVILLLVAPCFAQDKSYTIKGTIFDVDLSGELIELVELGEQANTTIQNTRVRSNTFSFSGQADKPSLCVLLVENHKVPIVLENAEITVSVYRDSTRISGTKVNDNFQAFINQSNAYRKRITELYSRLQSTPENTPQRDTLQKQLDEMEKNWQAQVVVKYIEDNINNPAGQRAFKSVFTDLSTDELKGIVAKVDSANLASPDIQKAIEQIYASEKTP